MFVCILALIIHDLSFPIQSQKHLSHQGQPQYEESLLSKFVKLAKETWNLSNYATMKRSCKGSLHSTIVILGYQYYYLVDMYIMDKPSLNEQNTKVTQMST